MATWNHNLPDYYAGLDVQEQHHGRTDDIARNPDNLQEGQYVYLGSYWAQIRYSTPDSDGRILIQDNGRYTRKHGLAQVRDAARKHARLEELRQELRTQQHLAA